jgi:hypothetical protein
VPLIVIAAPGFRVCPPMTYVVPDRAVKVFDPMVSRGAFVMTGWNACVRELVCPFMTTSEALGARDIVVPETVMTPPGVRTEEPIR